MRLRSRRLWARAIWLRNKRLLYDLLFRTSAATLLELARDPKHLGEEIGFLGVLHTWGQNLQHHPHIHYVVPASGLAPNGSRWIASSNRFFQPVGALSRIFRGKFTAGLRQDHCTSSIPRIGTGQQSICAEHGLAVKRKPLAICTSTRSSGDLRDRFAPQTCVTAYAPRTLHRR
jgi:hypothetical protein